MNIDTKPQLQAVPIWRCVDKSCKAWVGEELTGPGTPACPLCKGQMIRGIKHLPKLVKKVKTVRKPADPWK